VTRKPSLARRDAPGLRSGHLWRRGIRETPSPAPPLFLAVAADDALAVGRTVEQFTAIAGKGVGQLHVFQMGAHGFVNKAAAPTTSWIIWKNGSWQQAIVKSPPPSAGAETP